MIMRVLFASLLIVSTVLIASTRAVDRGGQSGDQFLDGIGETSLVARYLLNGNAEDSSRDHFHAVRRGSGGSFVEDPQFRRVLLRGRSGRAPFPRRRRSLQAVL